MTRKIQLKKIKVHNLKSINVDLEANQLIVCTGVSGSGKSSFAFDTLYTEGQRRYVESLSHFAKRQLGEMSRPDLESAEGVSPTISIEQKTAGRNPRSTVGTMTELYDYLRVLYARIAIPHCPVSGEAVQPQSRERIIRTIQGMKKGTKILILTPYARGKKAEFKEDFVELVKKGFTRVRVDGEIHTLDESLALDGSVTHDVDIILDRIIIQPENESRIAESTLLALQLSKGSCIIIDTVSEEETLFSMHAFSPKSGLSYPSLEPHDFSFNSPNGMCLRCHGLGEVNDFRLDLVIDPDKSIAEDCCSVATSYQTVRYRNIYDNLGRLYHFDVHAPWKKLSKKAQDLFLYGTGDDKWIKIHFVHPTKGSVWVDRIKWKGVLHEARERFNEAKSDSYKKKMSALMHRQACPECKGGRLKPYPAAATLKGKTLPALASLTIQECADFFQAFKPNHLEQKIGGEILKEIKERLSFLCQVGLHYLTLDRTAPTLSGGEAQRVRLASQIGCGLIGITYVLDEPSIGLHPRDNKKLIHTLKHLRDMGNTVVVVEHDEETIVEADHILDFGPGAGSQGGELIVDGTLQNLIESPLSKTGQYLSGKLEIPTPKKRRKIGKESLTIVGATHHNLKNITARFPLKAFVAVTGVSGSGKSSLVSDILYPALSNALHRGEMEVGAHKALQGLELIDKVIAIDQSPIGRNPRSNPATYIKLFDEIRDLFTELPEAKARGYKAGRFSFNVQEGSCPSCSGMGMIPIDMDFMEQAWSLCPECNGKRFDDATLTVLYKGKSIFDVLEMDVDEALAFFSAHPSIHHKLETLQNVGLGYIKLGQFSTTLSGGEAQRIKLAKELVRPSTGKTLYILDEPTTGLHFHDIKHLLDVLHQLVDRGNTVLVIEHNMDVIKTADWIIDIGPEGGKGGGTIIAEGTPEAIGKLDTPTGHAIQEVLGRYFQKKIHETIAKQKKEKRVTKAIDTITVEGAHQNNLKHLNVTLPRGKITVCTGPSGSGKSSLAFETIYAEGQRRYVESLSPYARQFVEQMPKPQVGRVEGLSPAIAIEQKIHAGNPRSTVGTLTEIYDYLRILYAKAGTPHCPETGEVIRSISKEVVLERILSFKEGEKITILSPVPIKKGEIFEALLDRFRRQGYVRIRLNGTYYDIDSPIPFDKKKKQTLELVIDRLKVSPSIRSRLLEALSSAGEQILIDREGEDLLFNLAFAVESTGKSYPRITPHTFSFNVPEGMCPQCEGLGFVYGANITQNPVLMELTPLELMESLWRFHPNDHVYNWLFLFFVQAGIDYDLPLAKQPPKNLSLFLNGAPDRWIKTKEGPSIRWEGLNTVLARLSRSCNHELKTRARTLFTEVECFFCKGERLNPLARHVILHAHSLPSVCKLPLEEVASFIKRLKLSPEDRKLLDDVLKQLKSRLKFLVDIGLGYISLHRTARTLSGGEAQRIRLARQMGSGLTGALYVLDEPTIGLHPHDNARLNRALHELKDLGNTLILVEHDPQTIQEADYLLDFGPGAGEKGGHIMARGTLPEILANPDSLTGQYLSGKKQILIPSKRRKGKGALHIKKATLNNLKKINVSIPLQTLTAVTGVSGSGKSTLIDDLLAPAIAKGLLTGESTLVTPHATIDGIDQVDKLIVIDQNPIGQTVRSNVATYVEVLDRIRDFFAELPLAKVKGLDKRYFSFNHRRGMCSHCFGLGYRRIEMHFLPAVKVTCEECQGLRLNPLSLEVRFGGKNLGEYLNSTVADVRSAFQNHPRITRILDTLIEVGLGYLNLGQEMNTLSGGEAQRIKLSRELARRSTGKTLYLMDEPTTGLHADDIAKLLHVIHRLIDKGNTMVIIEHNLDLIRNADYLVDLGPGPGEAGGHLVAVGTPEAIARHPTSLTGKWLSKSV